MTDLPNFEGPTPDPPGDFPVPGVPPGFLASNFPSDLHEVYVSTFRGLRRDSEARPGLQTLTNMLNERLAHGFTKLKAYDASPTEPYAPDYARASKNFTDLVKQVTSTVATDDTADVTIKLAMRDMTDSFLRAVDESVEDGLITEADRSALLRRFSKYLQDTLPG